MSKTRVYVVTHTEGEVVLVRATSPAQAIRCVAANEWSARIAKVDDVLDFGTDEVVDAIKGSDGE